MTLDIIIPHYKEPWEKGCAAFEMIRLQRHINFDDINVYVIQDGDNGALPEKLFEGYPYHISYFHMPHGGVSAARNLGMDAGKGDWIMFHDFDDAFASTYALFHVFEKMSNPEYNLIACEWVGEQRYSDTGGLWLRPGDGNDFAFLHGKFFRRSWLKENRIRFNPELTIHEDAFFVCLIRLIMPREQVCIVPGVQYATYFNEESVTRSTKEDFYFSTYEHFYKKANALIHELVDRRYLRYAEIVACQTLCDTYVDLSRITWIGEDISGVIRMAKEFAVQNTALLDACSTADYINGITASRTTVSETHDMGLEPFTLKEWLRIVRSDDN